MKFYLVCSLIAVLPLALRAQNPYTKSPEICGASHTFTAFKKASKFYLIADADTFKIGKNLTRAAALRGYTKQLNAVLDNMCPTDETGASAFVAFRISFPTGAVNQLFANTIPIPLDSLMLDDHHYFLLIKKTDQTLLVTLADRNGDPPVDILQWSGMNYTFIGVAFENIFIKQHLPELLSFEEQRAHLTSPTLVLKDNNDNTWQLIPLDKDVAGPDLGSISGSIGKSIRDANAEISLPLAGGGPSLNLKKIKRTNTPPPTSGAFNATPAAPPAKPAKTTDLQKGPLIAQREIVCGKKTSFRIAAYAYPPDPSDSIILTIRPTGAAAVDTLVPLDWDLQDLRSYTRAGPFRNLCADRKTDSLVAIFFVEYSARTPLMTFNTAARTATAATRSSSPDTAATPTGIAKAGADPNATDAPKAAAPKTDTTPNVVTIAGETDFAALIQLRGKKIPLNNPNCGSASQQQGWAPALPDSLTIDSVAIQISNNTINQLDIVGRLNNSKNIQTISNRNYGLALREFIDGNNSITFPVEGKCYELCFNDLFFIRPTDAATISYNIADDHYSLYPDSPRNQVKISQKRLLDFISASAFLDFQSFSQTSTNKNLLTEVYFNFPVHNQNTRRHTWAKYFYMTASLGLDLFNKNSTGLNAFYLPDSAIVPRAVPNTNPVQFKPDTLTSPAYYFKNFDLVQNNFLLIKPIMNILSIEYKESNLLLEWNGGFSFMGSNLKYVDSTKGVDSAVTRNVYSLGYLTEARIRFNPKVNFGVDLHLSYNIGQSALSSDLRSITGRLNTQTLVNSGMIHHNRKSYFQGEINLYFNPKDPKTTTDRGGIFVKLNLFKAASYTDGYFMFLVGYSTDIKNFFK